MKQNNVVPIILKAYI